MTPTRRSSRLVQLGRDSLYLFTAFPLWLAAFVAVVTGLSLGGGLLVIAVGVPVITLTLLVARAFVAIERGLQRHVLDLETPSARYLEPQTDSWWQRIVVPLRDPQSWLDVVGALVLFPVSLATWTVGIVWSFTAIAGVTYPLWNWMMPGSDADAWFELVGFGDGAAVRVIGHFLLGLFAAVTLPWLMRGMTLLQGGLARVLFVSRSEQQVEVASLVAGRAAAREAEATSLQRLERDIHDGPQQRLVRLSMDLGRAKRMAGDADPELTATLDGALAQTKETLDELRALSRGIAPPVLADRGLRAALEELAARSSVPIDLQVHLPEQRLGAHLESVVYFVVSEALTNVAKHSGATRANVWVAYRGHDIAVRVSDNGAGGAMLAKGHGLVGLNDRVRASDGTMWLSSPAGGPTILDVEVPCA